MMFVQDRVKQFPFYQYLRLLVLVIKSLSNLSSRAYRYWSVSEKQAQEVYGRLWMAVDILACAFARQVRNSPKADIVPL